MYPMYGGAGSRDPCSPPSYPAHGTTKNVRTGTPPMAARSKLIIVKLLYTPTKKKEPHKKNTKFSWGALRKLD